MAVVLALTEDEAKFIERIGLARHNAARAKGLVHVDKVKPAPWMDIIGFAGEFKASQYYRTRFYPSIGECDGGTDIKVAGYGIGIKATKNPWYQHLLVPDYAWPIKERCHALLLTRCYWPNAVEIYGWITRERFIREHFMKVLDPDYGEQRVMHMSQLEAHDTLKPMLLMSRHGGWIGEPL